MKKNVNAMSFKEVYYYYNVHNTPGDLFYFQMEFNISVSPKLSGEYWYASMPVKWGRDRTAQGGRPDEALMRLYLLHHVGEYIEVEEDN